MLKTKKFKSSYKSFEKKVYCLIVFKKGYSIFTTTALIFCHRILVINLSLTVGNYFND